MARRKNKNTTGTPNMGTLMAEADRLFSILIRLKDMFDNGQVMCYTCNVLHHFKEIHCGHFIGRSHLSTRWLEENARPQCYQCNVVLFGNVEEYSKRLEYDQPGIVEHLNRLKNEKKFRLKSTDVLEIISDLKRRIKECGGEKQIPQR